MKKLNKMIVFILLVIMLAACSGNTVETVMEETVVTGEGFIDSDSSTKPSVVEEAIAMVQVESEDFDSDDMMVAANQEGTILIFLDGDQTSSNGDSVSIEERIVTITSGGSYEISGSLSDGQIIVDSQDDATVRLILNNAEITSTISAPIYVRDAEKTVITLAEATNNYLADSAEPVFIDGDEPNGAIFSNDDLTINGSGSLVVNGNYRHGIVSDDDLKIVSGIITINAVGDGLQGRDSITIGGGQITISAGEDGLHANNNVDEGQGNVSIEGGVFEIAANEDGIQAETQLGISGGDIAITSGGGSINSNKTAGWEDWDQFHKSDTQTATSESDSVSAKGLKAGISLLISDGTLVIDSADDALHSNSEIVINGGNFQLSSGDDGIHSDSRLVINGGEVVIGTSYEGLESASISINGGEIHVVAQDDGINGSDGSASGMMGPGAGGGDFSAGDCSLIINDGYVYLNADGDGIDINGSIEMTDGIVIVNGPTGNQDGPFDYTGSFNISGGTFVAVGSAGMAQAPSATSTRFAFIYNFSTVQQAGTIFHIESSSGISILTFVPAKAYQSVIISSPAFTANESYMIFSGGSAVGEQTDGLIAGSTYTPGSEVETFTFSQTVVALGSVGGGWGGFLEGGGMPPDQDARRRP